MSTVNWCIINLMFYFFSMCMWVTVIKHFDKVFSQTVNDSCFICFSDINCPVSFIRILYNFLYLYCFCIIYLESHNGLEADCALVLHRPRSLTFCSGLDLEWVVWAYSRGFGNLYRYTYSAIPIFYSNPFKWCSDMYLFLPAFKSFQYASNKMLGVCSVWVIQWITIQENLSYGKLWLRSACTLFDTARTFLIGLHGYTGLLWFFWYHIFWILWLLHQITFVTDAFRFKPPFFRLRKSLWNSKIWSL